MPGDYRKIETGSEAFEPAEYNVGSKAHSRPKIASALRIMKYSLVALLSVWGFISIFMTMLRQVPVFNGYPFSPARHGCYCGTSSTEAKSMGCKYDSLAAAWLPERCRDDELTAEFDRSGDGPNGTWLYWRDTHHTIPITPEEIQYLGDTPGARFHMDYSWHEVHCLFYWRKEHRFRFNGKILDPRSDSEEHIKHCGAVWDRKATYGISVYADVNSFYGEFEFGLHDHVD